MLYKFFHISKYYHNRLFILHGFKETRKKYNTSEQLHHD